MRPHYDNYIHACVTAGIGYLNLLFSADDLDADGVPNQPEMTGISYTKPLNLR